MRSVIISSAILAIILSFTIINTVILNNFCEELFTAIENYDTDAQDHSALEELYDKFNEKSVYINLTVNHSMTNGVNEAFYELFGATEANDKQSARIAKSRLTYAVKRLWEMEKFSLLSIV